MAADLHEMSSMIKIDPEPRNFTAQRAIGSGFQSVLFADLRSVQDVEEAILSVRAEPKGKNGAAMNRVANYLYGGGEDFVKYCDDVVIAIMVEKKSLFDHLEEVLDLDIDMIQFGPMDFAMSVGVWGQPGNPKVIEAQETTIKMALKRDKHPRIELPSVENADKYLQKGVRDFCIGWDIRVVKDFLVQNASPLRKLLDV